MSEPNRLSAPGERAALARVEVIAERLDALPLDRFVPARHTFPSPEEHARLLAELEREAGRCGRSELLADVRDRVGTAIRARLSPPVRRLAAVEVPMQPSRAEDSALVELALTDAALVAVMEDRLDPITAARLAGPGRALLGLPPVGAVAAATPGPSLGEPTAEDWAEAAIGETQTGDYSPVPVGVRVALATATAVVGGSIAVFAGVGIGQTGAGLLAALAIVAVCWLVATYHRS